MAPQYGLAPVTSGDSLCDLRGLVSLTRPSHSQERVWYFTVQPIVLADSGCSVYTRLHSTQTTNTFAESAPHESRGVRTNHCIASTRPFLSGAFCMDERADIHAFGKGSDLVV